MAEATQGSPEDTVQEPAGTPSGLTAEQVSEIVREAMDSRVSGLMSSFDKRLDSVQKELHRATMSPDEIEDQREQAEAAELERLRRENAILTAGADMPAAVKAYRELNAKASGEEQLAFLQALIDAGAQAKAPAAASDESEDEEEEGGSDIDPNRQANVPPEMTEDAATSILDSFPSWPGKEFWRS